MDAEWESRQYQAVSQARADAVDDADLARRLAQLVDHHVRERIRLDMELRSARRELAALKGVPDGAPRFEMTRWAGQNAPYHLRPMVMVDLPDSVGRAVYGTRWGAMVVSGPVPQFEQYQGRRALCGAVAEWGPHGWPALAETCAKCVAVASARPGRLIEAGVLEAGR